MKRFSSILIANRGEIAVRIARTAQRLGYRVIAVYSDADVSAPHVQLADDAVRIGASAPRDSYLNAASIIAAAQHSGAGAVHPGYGFLAENAEFAQAVVDAGLIWIGPPPSAIRAMGDKAQAKRLMKVAEVPCVPGYDGDAQDEATLRAEGQRIGFPLMIKATAGGGGMGMRLVESAASFDAHLSSARSEAQAAFGDSTVLLERAIVQPPGIMAKRGILRLQANAAGNRHADACRRLHRNIAARRHCQPIGCRSSRRCRSLGPGDLRGQQHSNCCRYLHHVARRTGIFA